MASVVFLRGVNVGGRQSFKPSALADGLAELEVTNIGAAGTYVVQADVDEASLRERVQAKLPVEAEVLVCDSGTILALLEAGPPAPADDEDGVKAYLTLLAKPPDEIPPLPIERPEEGPWQTRLVHVEPTYALSVRRPEQPGRYYPNGLIEDVLGVPATTRGWPTLERIGRVLEDA